MSRAKSQVAACGSADARTGVRHALWLVSTSVRLRLVLRTVYCPARCRLPLRGHAPDDVSNSRPIVETKPSAGLSSRSRPGRDAAGERPPALGRRYAPKSVLACRRLCSFSIREPITCASGNWCKSGDSRGPLPHLQAARYPAAPSSTSRVMKIGLWSKTLSRRVDASRPVDDPAEVDVGTGVANVAI